MNTILSYLWVGLGGGLGTMARYGISDVVAKRFGETFPWGTLLVNVSGSALIGLFATLTAPDGRLFVSSSARTFIMLGIFGGYTTFSSFSLQTLALAQAGEWFKAAANAIASVILCLLAVWLGHGLAMSVNQLKGS